MANEVRMVHSGMAGAPVLSGTAGAMIAVLDAALANGFGTQTADSVVVASNKATVDRAAGVSMAVGTVIDLSGTTVTGGTINGARKVTDVTSTSFSFDATGIPAQTATGTATYKIAPLGWAKAFSGSGVAAYQTTSVQGGRAFLRVDDTGTTHARVVGYEAMSDVNTGTGAFPTNTDQAGGMHWGKSQTADATARDWVVWGDDRTFYFWIKYLTSSGPYSVTLTFGDPLPVRSTDTFCSMIVGARSAYATLTTAPVNDVAVMAGSIESNSFTASTFWMARAATGAGSAVPAGRTTALGHNVSSIHSGGTSIGMFRYPNDGDNALIVTPIYVQNSSSGPYLRGSMPGVYFCPQNIGTSVFQNRDEVTGVTGLPGRTLRAIVNSTGVMFTDVTGPWR